MGNGGPQQQLDPLALARLIQAVSQRQTAASILQPLLGPFAPQQAEPPLTEEQSRMGVTYPAAVQPADILGLLAGSTRTAPGRAALESERGAVGSKLPPPSAEPFEPLAAPTGPIRAYHGTRGQFESFGEKGPHFFTSSKAEAESYATSRWHGGEAGRVMEVELDMKKPYIYGTDATLDKKFDDLGGVESAPYSATFRNMVERRGYDGIMSEYGKPGDWNTYYIPLRGSQVKPIP